MGSSPFYAEPAAGEMTIVGIIEPELERLWHRAWGREADGLGAPPA